MWAKIIDFLEDYCDLEIEKVSNEEILEGKIKTSKRDIEIGGGVPHFYATSDLNQQQRMTNETFSYKWASLYETYTQDEFEVQLEFVIKRLRPLGITTKEEFVNFLSAKECILDAGAGNGWMSRFMAENTSGEVISAEIADGVYEGYKKCKQLKNCHIVKADLLNLPFKNNLFDYIHSDGVLHHTPDCKGAVKALYDRLKPGGVFWFYIYREMNPVKHFCDDYIRTEFNKLSPQEAEKACEAITELGRELSKINATIELKKPINILNIPAGTYDVQRFIYYNFMKCYWNEKAGYAFSNMVNFDWYHPNTASQHTVEQVEAWIKEFGIEKYDIYIANPNGINVFLYK